MKGYFNRPEETAQVLTSDGGLKTGDMGYLDKEGYLFITGRIKEQYKLENGKYVVPTPLEEMLKVSPYILNSLIYGDNRPYNVAVIAANVPTVKEWADGQGIPSGDEASLLAHPRVRELFEKEIASCSKEYRHYELIQDFLLIPTDFTTQNGMLTASLKVKRRKVIETYGNLIEELYAKKARPARSAAPAA
jgi:long-chain acyl-CoA synthetase